MPHSIVAIGQWAATLAVPGTLLAVCVSAVFLVTGWRRRQIWAASRHSLAGAVRLERDKLPYAGPPDLASIVAGVLRRAQALAGQRFVGLEMAVQPSLVLDVSPSVLQEILAEIIERAIEESPCGRVLVSAADIGGRVRISVSDDGGAADRALRANWLQQAQRTAALQHATMDIITCPGQGTTVILWFPHSPAHPAEAVRAADPAEIWTPADRRAAEKNSAAL